MNKQHYKYLVSFLFLIASFGSAYGQSDSLAAITRQFSQYSQHHLTEKIYMHLDRPVYVSGETMWYKIYTVDGSTNKPLSLSKVAYVEVLDAQQRPVLQTKIELANGTGNGSFIIPVTLTSGHFTVRAYTNWMKNDPADFFFQSPVTILNTRRAIDPTAAKDTSTIYTLQFFPEGGNLVQGISSKVGFKLENNQGQTSSFTGEIIDGQNKVITNIASFKFGMGNFTFTPQAQTEYHARITLPNKKVITQKLPAVFEEGYVMQLDATEADRLKITVQTKLPNDASGSKIYLLAHARQQTTLTESASLNQGQATFIINKNILAEGISHFTIFNNQKKPVCERLYFKMPTEKLVIEAKTDKTQYSAREKITLDLATQLKSKTGTAANLSLTVYRLDSLQKMPGHDIESYFWLSSDLKGPIQNPGYYFSGTSPDVTAALDNLMLTQGWRRFRWEDVLKPKITVPQFIPEINGLLINGQVADRLTGAPAKNMVTYLAAPSKHIRLYNAVSNAQGMFQFEVRDFYGPKEIVVQTNSARDSTYSLKVFSPFSEKYSAALVPSFILPEMLRPNITLRHVQTQVQDAYHNKYKRLVKLPEVDSLPFYGKADERYRLDDFTRFKVMEEVMREYVPGVMVRLKKDGFHFMTLDKPRKTIFEGNPLVLLDGVPVFNINKIMAFDPLKVQRLEVMTSRYFHGSQFFDGLVSFTTYQGDLGGFTLDKQALLVDYEGLQLQREFYAPTYETTAQQQSRLPDLRNLLYWNPNINTTATSKKQLQFYSSDQDGKYIVVVQGISPEGHVGHVFVPVEVKKPL